MCDNNSCYLDLLEPEQIDQKKYFSNGKIVAPEDGKLEISGAAYNNNFPVEIFVIWGSHFKAILSSSDSKIKAEVSEGGCYNTTIINLDARGNHFHKDGISVRKDQEIAFVLRGNPLHATIKDLNITLINNQCQ